MAITSDRAWATRAAASFPSMQTALPATFVTNTSLAPAMMLGRMARFFTPQLLVLDRART
jgi:hypothetical protein